MHHVSVPPPSPSVTCEYERGCTAVVVQTLEELLTSGIVHVEDWEELPVEVRDSLCGLPSRKSLLAALVEYGLLTEYQLSRLEAGTTFGLILGNYRVLDRLGAGGMAVVFKAEHLDLRNTVAIKVLPMTADQDPRLQLRFTHEMRVIAQLRHPNIVSALDAGRVAPPSNSLSPVLWYLVMEHVAGKDLEVFVLDQGPLTVARACHFAHQTASALVETHKFNLVHRDIKPSNILIGPEDQAKLVDFGLARQFETRLTQTGTVLGTLEYMAPEQAHDATTVDVRADLYGLGGTLYWCLTGLLPFPPGQNLAEGLLRRLTQPPPSVRAVRSDVPEELDNVLGRLMTVDPAHRYQTPQAVLGALLPFLKPTSPECLVVAPSSLCPTTISNRAGASSPRTTAPRSHRVLIVDDEAAIRRFCVHILQAAGLECIEAANGPEALEVLARTPCDVMLLDMHMPRMNGLEVLRQIQERSPVSFLKTILLSGEATSDEMAKLLMTGADDFLGKPFSITQLQARVQAALRLKDAQDRTATLNQHLLAVNAELERNLSARSSDLVHVRNALVLGLAQLVEHRDTLSGHHLLRMQRYCRILAEHAAWAAPFADQIDEPFIEMLTCCAPLHDIGKAALPDHILLKPGKLMPDERLLMQTHTTTGSDTLRQMADEHRGARAFLQMATDISRHHHERYDGSGYPDRLSGTAIPLAARIVAICDVYDALRCRRVYKPALGHAAALQMMTEASPGQFDPAILQVFLHCAGEFEKIYQELKD